VPFADAVLQAMEANGSADAGEPAPSGS
jgi:hypothetical protein